MDDRTIDRCLHDAEHADRGANVAGMAGDSSAKQRLRATRDALLREAIALDPTMRDDAWLEIDPILLALAKVQQLSVGGD